MQYVVILKADGTKEPIQVYNIHDFPYDRIDKKKKLVRNKRKYINSYYQAIGAFDIETTTVIPKDETPPWGFMYHWQFCIDGIVCIGRYWLEFIEFLEKLQNVLGYNERDRLVIYIFNLSFEFQFMRDFLIKYLGDITIFATHKRKVLKVNTSNGLEFRCAYKLTNQNLYNATKNELGVEHIKAKSDLDYRKFRTPKTELDAIELGYCVSDVVSLYELIRCKLKNDKDNLETIPMTSTGYPRRDCRRACRQNTNYRQDVFEKQTMTEPVYLLLKEESRGGNTHANRRWSSHIADSEEVGDIHSFDFASSYPAQQLLKQFPMSKFEPYGVVENKKELSYLLDRYACLFRISFDNLRIKDENIIMPYIPTAKCIQLSKGKNGLYDNGRILSCESATMTLNDIDYRIIESQYAWDNMYISDMHIANYGYLPPELTNQIMRYFNNKCILKEEIADLEESGQTENEIYKDKVYQYSKSKNLLNGIFGMSFTDPIHNEVSISEDGEWFSTLPDIATTLKKYNNSRNSFLVYAWGCWTTARAREYLQKLLDITDKGYKNNAGQYDGTIYIDTDSSKCINPDFEAIEKFNAEIRKLCEERKAYCDVKGKRYYIGIAELETDTEKKKIQKFCTLGAKKYCYIDGKGLHLTVSGVNKEKGAKELCTIDNFVIGYTFKEAGGNTLYYNDGWGVKEIEINGERFLTASNIGIVDSTYTIGITGEYADLCGIDLNIYA